MFKRMILLTTIIFLLFEVIYFDSNKNVELLQDNKNGSNVYKISIDVVNNKEQFFEDYEDIILEIIDDEVTVLTDSKNFTKITKKYPIRIVK